MLIRAWYLYIDIAITKEDLQWLKKKKKMVNLMKKKQ